MQFGDESSSEPDPWRPEPPARQALPLNRGPVVGPRFALDRMGALAVPAALAVGAVVLVVVLLTRSGSSGSTVGDAGPLVSGPLVSGVTSAPASVAAVASPVAATAPASASSALRVYVVGQVKRPGVVSLPAGARVEDAVQAAGGVTRSADLAAVNLARPLADGEQLYLTKPGEDPPAGACGAPVASGSGAAAGGTTGATASVVDLNSATIEQLDGLPGVGPVLARRILEWRQQHGRFANVDELGEVQGIGDATLEKLRPQVRV